MKQLAIKILKRLFNKFFLILFSEDDFPKTKSGSLSLIKNVCFDSKLGKHTKIRVPYDLRQIELDDYSYIAKNSLIAYTKIGKFCSIGPNFCCGLGIHPTNGISTSPMFYSTAKQNGISLVDENLSIESEAIFIGNDVFIGANVTVLDGVTIGNGAVIGAGAVVTCDVPAYCIAGGVPAKIKKFRFDEETIAKLNSIKWWDWDMEKLKTISLNFTKVDSFLKNINELS